MITAIGAGRQYAGGWGLVVGEGRAASGVGRRSAGASRKFCPWRHTRSRAKTDQAMELWVDTAYEFGDAIPEPKGERLMPA